MVNFSINAVRILFLAVTTLLGMLVALGFEVNPLWGSGGGLIFGMVMIGLEAILKHFTFREFSHGTVGLMIGLFCAWLILRVDFFSNPYLAQLENVEAVRQVVELVLYVGLGFLGMMLAMRSNREEFSFIIPYVRFRQDSLQEQPHLLDTNVIIDGRIPRICETGFLSGSLIIPRFVIDELHVLADTNDPIKKDRGKRGLECVNQMHQATGMTVTIHDEAVINEENVDTKLVVLARRLGARIVTNDANLCKVARLQGVRVLNFNELSKALRPIVSPGDKIDLMLVKEGKESHQAVGYLPDGTMLVVNRASGFIGESRPVVVAGSLQTSAGRLIFAELEENWESSQVPSGGAIVKPKKKSVEEEEGLSTEAEAPATG
ncbi:MAG: PIN domain nuclease [Verrucomicrobiota bacterium]